MAKREGGTTRRLTLLVGALDALFIVALTFVVLIALGTAVWLLENDPDIPWVMSLQTMANFWFVAHGVSIHVLPQDLVGIPVPEFTFSLAPILLLGAVYLFGRRTAKKLAMATEFWPGWLGAFAVYLVASIVLTPIASAPTVHPDSSQAAAYPAMLYLASIVVTNLFGKGSGDALERVWLKNFVERQSQSANWFFASLSSPALRAGTGVVVGLLGVSALWLGLSLAFNWIPVIRLYEGLQVSAIGGIVVTLGQLFVLPNLIIFGAAWFTGVGFSIGTGSSVSPIGTELGPIPALPIFGGLPIGDTFIGLAAIVVPVVLALVCTVWVKSHTKQIRFNFASPLTAALSLGLGVGLVAAVESGVLAMLASGGIGPGRLATFGINPWMLALVVFVEVAPVSFLAAFYSARPEKAAPIPDYLKR
ncbi:MAG: hypothetical protein KGL77_05950 [Actinomycetales bacterium]|nr:hypothetical protein [Actinomycetales bacterium]